MCDALPRSSRRFLAIAGMLVVLAAWFPGAASAAGELSAGGAAPAFTYRLIDGKTLTPAALRGHPYVLWLVATWCPSCEGGTAVMAQHIDELRSRGVRVVEVEVANDLGYPGPPLTAFQKAAGMAAASPNWYWGELTETQTRLLDPHAYPDIYYLVDAHGRIVAIDGAPAATWPRIATFVASVCPSHCP
ncbi:MAG: redoxin domain-containing protein [bacterium]|nr:redoxin domain-containing protein [bacterium]